MRVLLFTLILFLPSLALADEEYLYCMDLAADINKKLPLKIDELTKVKSTTCKKGDPITFQYFYYIERAISPEEITKFESYLNNSFKTVLGPWCTNPEQQLLLGLFDVKYLYYDLNDKYLGEVKITQNDCSRK